MLSAERTHSRRDFPMPSPNFYFPSPYSLLQAIRLPFWFACFWVVVGTVWRPPLASVILLALFIVLLVAVEWMSRRLTTKNILPSSSPETEFVLQQMIRTKTPEGLDRLDGTFWAEFPAEAMTATVHIPFCPAFATIPKVQVFPVDETSAYVRIAPPKTFGVRVDVKRNSLKTDRLCFVVSVEG